MDEFDTHTTQTPCKQTAYIHAVKLLAKKDYSEYKLRTKLRDKGFSAEEIDETINELLEKKYLREDYYAEARIKGLMNKGYSPSYIQSRLKEEFVEVSLDTIYSIFNEYELSEQDQIKKLVRKKLNGSAIEAPIDFNLKVKILRFLASKGHSVENVDQYLPNDFN